VERAGQYIGTAKQFRFGLLPAACGPEELWALPAWIAAEEAEDKVAGSAIGRVYTKVQAVLEEDCMLECNPLVAPQRSRSRSGTWGCRTDWVILTATLYSLLPFNLTED
jgi:hypothetical protein